ncbi:hypothetical protein GCM10010465_24730 [Actinomadura fibrosa]
MTCKQKILYVTLMFFCSWIIYAQEEHEADSLKKVYWSQPTGENNLKLLDQILSEERDPDSLLRYSRLLILSSIEAKNKKYLLEGYRSRGVAYRYRGDYIESLENLYKAVDLAEELDLLFDVAVLNAEIGNTFSENDDTDQAIIYYDRGINILRDIDSVSTLGLALYNAGDNLFIRKELDSALVYTLEARRIFRDLKNEYFEAYAEGNLGRIIFSRGGNLEQAETYLLEAVTVLEEVSDYNALTDFYSTLSDIYIETGNYDAAIMYAEKSLEAAKIYKMKTDLENRHLKLSQLYEEVGNIPESYEHFKSYVIYKDSLENVEEVKK